MATARPCLARPRRAYGAPGNGSAAGREAGARPRPATRARAEMGHQPRWSDANRAFKRTIGYDAEAGRHDDALAVIARGGGAEIARGVYFLGHRSKDTIGASAYLIQRPDGGNVMVDCARPDERLVNAVKQLGGAKYHVMTHTDDVAGHDEWHRALGGSTVRVMHNLEKNGWNAREAKTDEMEVWLGLTADELPAEEAWAAGTGPWTLGGHDSHLTIHHVPGHSPGSVVLHVSDVDGGVLLTGDHISFLHSRIQRKKLLGFPARYSRDYNEQIASVRALSALEFAWILPGHGRLFRVDAHKGGVEAVLEQAAQDMEAGNLD